MTKTTLSEYQEIVDQVISTQGGYWQPLSLISAILEELGELSRNVNTLEGFKINKIDPHSQIDPLSLIKEEIGDLIYAVICLGNSYDINLDLALQNSIKKYKSRDLNRYT